MLFVKKSKNEKISGPSSGRKAPPVRVSATYAPIEQSCPSSCELRGNGCYAQQSHVGILNRKLEGQACGKSPEEVAMLEAAAIDSELNPRSALRLHVAGDARTPEAARILSDAVTRWYLRGGGRVWTYTHAWREVPRDTWGRVSVMASVSSVDDIVPALAQGYAPALVVAEFPELDNKGSFTRNGVSFRACPAQLKDTTSCADCKLCLKADYLRDQGKGVAFAAHGAQAKKVRLAVTQ